MDLEQALTIIAQGLGVGIVVGGFLWRALSAPINRRIDTCESQHAQTAKAQGERLGEVETSCRANSALMGELQRKDQQHDFQLAALKEDFGKIESSQMRIEVTLEKVIDVQRAGESVVVDRLARIETRMDIFGELKEVLIAAMKRG